MKQFHLKLVDAVVVVGLHLVKNSNGWPSDVSGLKASKKILFLRMHVHSVEFSAFFLSLRFYVKSILENLEVLKLLLILFLGL